MSSNKIIPTEYDPVNHNDVERIKSASDYLRGSITEGLVDPITGSICDDDQILIKFHGIYQQDDQIYGTSDAKQSLSHFTLS